MGVLGVKGTPILGQEIPGPALSKRALESSLVGSNNFGFGSAKSGWAKLGQKDIDLFSQVFKGSEKLFSPLADLQGNTTDGILHPLGNIFSKDFQKGPPQFNVAEMAGKEMAAILHLGIAK